MTTNTNNTNNIQTLVLNYVGKASGWSVKDDTALSTLGTLVRFTAKTATITNTTSKTKTVIKLDTATLKSVVAAIVEVEKKAKTTAVLTSKQEAPKQADITAQPTTTKKGSKTMPETTTKTPAQSKKELEAAKKADVAAKKKAQSALAALESVEVKKEKVVPVKPANPAGDQTPVYEELKAAVEKTHKADEAIKGMWAKIGEKYNNSVTPLTTALLAEGLWPAATDAKGNLTERDGLQVPMGYQKVYKAEKEQGVVGIGHLVNTAAAAFGRINMERGKAEAEKAVKSGTATPAQETLNEKTISKLILQLETAASKLDAVNLKSWLETSKTMQPILDAIIAENEALGALAD